MKHVAAAMLFLACASAQAAGGEREKFHKAVYALHEKLIAQHSVRTTEETGKYNGVAAGGERYLITSYYDTVTGIFLSRIQRNAVNPSEIHISEVNIYDDKGKLIRDYFTSAPPWRPNYPSHAYINLHHYNGKLHSWRQFEITGEVNYESCDGELDGKQVRISLDWTDIKPGNTSSPEYHACFDGMSNEWKSFVDPK